jgi:hypothetical protein
MASEKPGMGPTNFKITYPTMGATNVPSTFDATGICDADADPIRGWVYIMDEGNALASATVNSVGGNWTMHFTGIQTGQDLLLTATEKTGYGNSVCFRCT